MQKPNYLWLNSPVLKVKQLTLTAVAVLWLSSIAFSQQSRYPVTLTASVKSPCSVYISDFFDDLSNIINGNLVLNDLQEPSLDVYLTIRFESPMVLLSNIPTYKPRNAIAIFPGEPAILNGSLLEECFRFDNLNISGMTREEFMLGGKLPEGMYTFTLEVHEYMTGRVVSNIARTNVLLKLFEPPVVLVPTSKSVVRVMDAQNITFQWQTPISSPNHTNYQLELYELTNPSASELTAIDNNEVKKLFQSEITNLTTLNYGVDEPLLERGKTYIVRVQAIDDEGRQPFKNNGYSVPLAFYYGYPEGGKIRLITPENKKAFSIREQKYFEWSAADNLTTAQPVRYQMRIAKTFGLVPDSAIKYNPIWHQHETPVRIDRSNQYELVEKLMEPQAEYAWQIDAYTEDQMIARSPAQLFYGPPPLEEFFAFNHKVVVTKADNNDKLDLSGEGRILIGETGEYFEVTFEHLRIENFAGLYVLREGTIKCKIDFRDIVLTPDYSDNGPAYFHPDSVMLDAGGLQLHGTVEWAYPHATRSAKPPVVLSAPVWLNFDRYKLIGIAPLDTDRQYPLLDPVNFRMKLDKSSDFYIYDNVYKLRFNGEVWLPKTIRGYITDSIFMPFEQAPQLYYITEKGRTGTNTVGLLRPGTGFELVPHDYYIDLSAKTSPPSLVSAPGWKGVYFENSEVKYNLSGFDSRRQLEVTEAYLRPLTLKAGDGFRCWAQSTGLEFSFAENLGEDVKGKFNQFPATYTHFKLDIAASNLNEGHLLGTIKIPVLSETRNFSFTTPISSSGFRDGYLDEELAGQTFDFNAGGGQQKLRLTINRAVFAEKERLDMNITIDWPAMELTFSNLDGFRAYGNYEIGFYAPGGNISLTRQMRTTLNGFELTIDFIGAGRQKNLYAIGTSAKAMMAEDVAGPDGPPVVNLYSIAPNSLLEGSYTVQADARLEEIAKGSRSGEIGSSDAGGKPIDTGTDPFEEMEKSLQELKAAREALMASYDADTTGSGAEVSFAINPDELIISTTEYDATGSDGSLTPEQQAKLNRIITALINRSAGGIIQKSASLTAGITTQLVTKKEEIKTASRAKISEMVTGLANGLAESMGDGAFASAATTVIAGTVDIYLNQLVTELDLYIDTAIVAYIANLGPNIIRSGLSAGLTSLTTQMLDGHALDIDLNTIIDETGRGVASQLNWDLISGKLSGFSDVMLDRMLDPELILNALEESFRNNLSDIAKAAVMENAEALVSAVLDNTELDDKLTSFVADKIGMDFDNLEDKMTEKLGLSVKFDPSHIVVNTRVAEFEGMIKFFDDDPDWGDSWQAVISAKIKVAPIFSAMVKYVNGTKPDGDSNFKYWFLQLGAYGLGVPMTPMPITFDGAEGKVYHHMAEKETDTYLPDKNTKFGVGLKAFFYDSPSKGTTIIFDVGLEMAFLEGGFILQLEGNAGIMNKSDDATAATIFAQGLLQYNSIEKHFLASLKATVNASPIICGGGEFFIDIRKDQWKVALGTREDPVILKLLCSNFLQTTSWFVINNTGVDLGLILNVHADITSPWIGSKRVKFQGYIIVDFEFGTTAVVVWKPSFEVLEAKVWIDLLVALGVKYKIYFKEGDLRIAEVAFGGGLSFATVPETFLDGTMYGRVKVLGFGIGFDMAVHHTF